MDREISNPAKLASVDRAIERMKSEPEIYLESTRRYVMPDPEDVDSVYDTCDVLGPWHTLNEAEKRFALEDFDWSGISAEDKQRIVERELAAGGDVTVPGGREYADSLKRAMERAKFPEKRDDRSMGL